MPLLEKEKEVFLPHEFNTETQFSAADMLEKLKEIEASGKDLSKIGFHVNINNDGKIIGGYYSGPIFDGTHFQISADTGYCCDFCRIDAAFDGNPY